MIFFINFVFEMLFLIMCCLSFLSKVVSSVVRYGDPKLVHPLSLAAAHCMGEVTLSSETRESSHNYPNDTVDEVKSVRHH